MFRVQNNHKAEPDKIEFRTDISCSLNIPENIKHFRKCESGTAKQMTVVVVATFAIG